MTRPKTMPPHTHKIEKLAEVAAGSLEVGIEVLGLLSEVTKNVPYLSAITGCIQKLIDAWKSMKSNKERAEALLNSIWDVSSVLARGLQPMDPQSQSTAANLLKDDLQSVLAEMCRILEEWTSQGFMKRLWSHGDFSELADGMEFKINAFRDVFSTSRLIALSQGQDAMDAKLQILVDENIRTRLDKWLSPPVHIANNQRSAANARHPKTGLWLLKRPEFREWIYAPGSFLWLHGMSGSGKTVLRAEHYVFFYFDTNNSKQQTVTQLLCTLVTQLSTQSHPPDSKLDALWTSHSSGRKLLTDQELISDALLPLLKEYGQKPIFMVLDALDECLERSDLLRLISRMLTAKLPNVHLLVTSRPEVQFGHPELAKLAVSLSLEGCVYGDIQLYLTELLSNETGFMYKKRDEIKRRLLERSNGMFRLVVLQLEELRNCDGTRSQVDKALKNMPTSLNTIYDRILQNIKNPGMLSRVCHAMNWLIFSERPMELDEIIDALAFDFEHEPLLFDTEERMGPDVLLPACAGFVAVSGDVKIAHSSVKEYFLDATQPRLSGDCVISEQAAHHLLARTCIAYLCSFDHVLNSDADLQQYPLTFYAVENWVFHLKRCVGVDKCRSTEKFQQEHIGSKRVMIPASRAAQNVDVPKVPNHIRELIDAVMQLIQPESIQYSTLLHLYDVESLRLRYRFEWASTAASLPPLYVATCLGIGQIVWELLVSGADVNGPGGEYGNALQAASLRGYIEIARLLLESGADVNALYAASHMGHFEIARLLLESGADVNAQGGEYSNALQIASLQGHIEIAHLLLTGGADVNTQGGKYGNALQAASLEGHIELACLLLESSADVNMQGGAYGNALYAASHGGHIEIARLLLKRGADVNAQGGKYGNALYTASYRGHIEISRLLVESSADVNAQGGAYGNTLYAASRGGEIEIARLLLNSGADVNAQGGKYGNALQAASLEGHIQLIRLLLDSGADVNAQGGKYGNALYTASYRGHLEISHLLLERGADVNAQGGECGSALQAASRGGEIEIARLLLNSGADVNAQGGKYGSALQAASLEGHIQLIRLLLDSGADVNAQGGTYGNTLQAASYWGHITIARLLLKHGANVNAQGGEYGNAQQAALYGRELELARLLLESGADINALGGKYGNVLRAASFNGDTEIADLLSQMGATDEDDEKL